LRPWKSTYDDGTGQEDRPAAGAVDEVPTGKGQWKLISVSPDQIECALTEGGRTHGSKDDRM
jgi:hypothetical protein